MGGGRRHVRGERVKGNYVEGDCVALRVDACVYDAEGTDKRAVRCGGGKRMNVHRGRMEGNRVEGDFFALRAHACEYICRGNRQEGGEM